MLCRYSSWNRMPTVNRLRRLCSDIRFQQREPDSKRTAVPLGAVDLHDAAVQGHNLADDREPDPGSRHPARIEVAGAVEPLKELGTCCLGDTNPLVTDRQHSLRVLLFDAD